MQSAARPVLLGLVEEQVTNLIRDAVAVQRHSKRARLVVVEEENDDDATGRGGSNGAAGGSTTTSRLHAADVNVALQWSGSEKLYGTGRSSQEPVSLSELLRDEGATMPPPPGEIAAHRRWLAVDGEPPDVGRGEERGALVQPPPPHGEYGERSGEFWRVRQLQAAVLSEELMLYFTRVTAATERPAVTSQEQRQQDAVLRSLSADDGLQELVPFLIRYAQQRLYAAVAAQPAHAVTLVRLVRALLRNPHVHTELHLHEVLPALTTCVVVAPPSPSSSTAAAAAGGGGHWRLRREAAAALAAACDLFASDYATLRARVLRVLCRAAAPGRSLAARYGGLTALTLFGCRAIDAFLLPLLLDSWLEWEEALTKPNLSDGEREEIHMCQQAALEGLGVFLQHVSTAEKAARLSALGDVQDVLRDRLVVLNGEATDYATCFV
jgi:transcription initiation factor TFIID subunit 6